MRRWISRLAAFALPCVTWFAATAAPGDWDPLFAQVGRLPFTIPGVEFSIRDWTQQPDGKVVVVGHPIDINRLETSGYIAARFNLDGSPDPGFDADGYTLFDFGSPTVGLVNVQRQADGKLLIAGQAGPSYADARLLRLNVNGSRDSGYGLGGEVTIAFPNNSGIANPTVKLTPAGDSVVVSGYVNSAVPGALGQLAVTRVSAMGVIDTSFGTGGTAFVQASDYLFGYLIDVASDGKILLAGERGPFQNETPIVARLTSTGQPDATFGTAGLVTLPFLVGDGYTTDMAAAPDGQVVFSGNRYDANGNQLTFIAKLTNTGTLDPAFGSAGRIILARGSVESLAVEPDGKIVVAGASGDQFVSPSLSRYDADGSPDVAFGTRGTRLTDFATGPATVGSALRRLHRNADGSYTALVILNDSVLNNFATSYVLAHFLAQGTSPGLLGIRAEFESSASGGFYSVYETTPKQKFYVYRSGGTDGAVSVQYRTVSGTATAGQDFVAKTGTITFNDGESLASFDVDVIDDAVPETIVSENFHAELFNPTGGAAISRQRATIELSTDNDYGQRVEVTSGDYVIESGSAKILLNRTGDMRGALTMNYTVTPGSASAGSDYVATSGSVQWPANAGGYQEFTIPLVDDAVAEPNETFTVTISDPNGVAAGSTINQTILDDDDTTGPSAVAFGAAMVSVNEGAPTATLQLYRLGDASQPLEVPWQIDVGSGTGAATPGDDFVSASGTVLWAAGNRSVKTIPITLVNDTTFEQLEQLFVSLNVPFPVTALGTPVAVVSIKDDDGTPSHPVISIGAGGNAGEVTQTLSIPVTLTGLTTRMVAVDYLVTPESASSNDLVASAGTLVWQPGASGTRTIDLTILDDALDEQDETFSVTLSRPTDGATLGNAQGRFTIIDNDPTPPGQPGPIVPSVKATPASVTVAEGQRTVSVDLTRVGDTGDWLYVLYGASDGTASSPDDYVLPPGEVAWPPNDSTVRHIEMQINGDAVSEPTETLSLNLAVTNIGYTGPVVTVPVTITDDDTPAQPASVGFLAATQSVSESQTAVVIPVSRAGNTSIASSVDYATAVGTAGSADFTASTGTLTWAANDTSMKSITIPLLTDTIDEPDENFTVTLGNASSGTTIATAISTITIQDDDVPPPPARVGFSSAITTVPENTTVVSLEVARTGDTSGALSVDYATSVGSATAGDFTAKSGTLTWAANDATPKSITIALLPDTIDEADESFTVTLSTPSGALLDRASATVAIVDDDDPAPPLPAHVGVSNATQSVAESATTATILVNRTGNTATASSVDYATAAGSAGTSDFTASSGTLTWAANDTAAKSITVTLLPDTVDEPDEVFTVTLSNASPGTQIDLATTTVTIVDDDDPAPPLPAHVGVMSTTQSVSESQSSVTIQIGRSGNTAGASSVDYATATGTAGASDYTAATGTLTWAANDAATKSVTITLLPDATDEPDETFTLTLSNPSSGTTLDGVTTTVTITDDDPAPPAGGGSSGGGSSSGGGGKGGGSESLLSLLALATLLLVRIRKPGLFAGGRLPTRH